MNIEQFRTYCLSKKHVTESFPFDDATLVFKVANKLFALSNLKSKITKALIHPNLAVDKYTAGCGFPYFSSCADFTTSK